jgi:signal transduction histidine kinase/CheY-like chemotaxis protein
MKTNAISAWFLRASLAVKIALAAALLTSFTTVIIGCVSYYLMRNITIDQMHRAMSHSATDVARHMEGQLLALTSVLSSLAANTLIGNALVDNIGRDIYLRSFLGDFDRVNNIPVVLAITDFRGEPFSKSASAALFADQRWLRSVVDVGEPRYTIVKGADQCYFILAEPVIFANTGQPEGTLVMQLPVRALMADKAINEFYAAHELQPALALEFPCQSAQGIQRETLGEVPTWMLAARTPVTSSDSLKSLGVQLEIYSDPRRITRKLNDLLWAYLIAGFAVLVLVLLASRLLARSLTQRLRRLEYATRDISFDNLGNRRLPEDGYDEVSHLGRTFNQVLERLESAYATLNNSRLEVQASLDCARQAHAAAEQANQTKTEFLANMSHELRTPLNAILGFSRMMARECENCSYNGRNLHIVIRSGEHLLALINDVLDMSRIEVGKVALDEQSIDLFEVLEDVGMLIRQRAEEKDLRYRHEIDPGLHPYVCVDASKLRQILFNLLDNAIKYTEHGEVVLRARTSPMPEGDVHLYLEVEDTGRGIPAHQLERIFDKFEQVGKVEDHKAGTGLGLAISRSYAELLRGRIGVTSVEGKGSCFSVDLLLQSVSKPPLKDAPRQLSPPSLPPGSVAYRMLIVDDKPADRLLLRHILEAVGLQVFEAANGEQGVAQCQLCQPDIVWMDLRMPYMDGYQATQQIRAAGGGLACKIIAVSAAVFDEDRKKTRDAGCDGFLHKPYRDADVYRLLEEHLSPSFTRQIAWRPADASAKKRHLQASDLEELPTAYRQQLCTSVIEGDIAALQALLQARQAQHPHVVAELLEMVHQYRLEQMVDLLTAPAKHG